jgi:hypothetical protein
LQLVEQDAEGDGLGIAGALQDASSFAEVGLVEPREGAPDDARPALE